MSKYAVLTTHLMAREDPVIEMTFDELDRVVSGLPASARKHSAWWSNSWTSQPHAFAWLDAGRLATPDFNAGRVRFVIGAPATGIGEKRRVARRTEAKHSLAELKATGESTEALIRYEWLGAGLVELVGGRPMMPRLPEQPGIYRFTIRSHDRATERFYVGESDNLSRRMGNYRNPGPTQPTNIRLHALLSETLTAGGSADLAVVLQASISDLPLDLTKRPSRLLVENVALVKLGSAGMAVENL